MSGQKMGQRTPQAIRRPHNILLPFIPPLQQHRCRRQRPAAGDQRQTEQAAFRFLLGGRYRWVILQGHIVNAVRCTDRQYTLGNRVHQRLGQRNRTENLQEQHTAQHPRGKPVGSQRRNQAGPWLFCHFPLIGQIPAKKQSIFSPPRTARIRQTRAVHAGIDVPGPGYIIPIARENVSQWKCPQIFKRTTLITMVIYPRI